MYGSHERQANIYIFFHPFSRSVLNDFLSRVPSWKIFWRKNSMCETEQLFFSFRRKMKIFFHLETEWEKKCPMKEKKQKNEPGFKYLKNSHKKITHAFFFLLKMYFSFGFTQVDLLLFNISEPCTFAQSHLLYMAHVM